MNPMPAFILAFLSGYFVGHWVAWQQAQEALEGPTWEQVQREVAPNQ